MCRTKQLRLVLLKAMTPDIRKLYSESLESATEPQVIFAIDWQDSLGHKFAKALVSPEELGNAKAERDGGVRFGTTPTVLRALSVSEAEALFAHVGVSMNIQAFAELGRGLWPND
jgi:hypothetical protein